MNFKQPSRGTLTQSSDGRRIARAVDHVNNFWIPINPELHEKIRSMLDSTSAVVEMPSLLEELRGDPALFLYAIREVSVLLREEGHIFSTPQSPTSLLEWAGIDKLRKILSKESNKISPHSIESSTEAQLSGIEEMHIASTASKLLAEAADLDPEVAFTSTLLRSLGYALIAWNYPSVYQGSLLKVRPSRPLDAVLLEELGFSPQALATKVIEQWMIPDLCIASLNERIPSGKKATFQTLKEICDASIRIARACHPEIHPSAPRDWEKAKKQIEKYLGAQGLEIIANKLQENASGFFEYPDVIAIRLTTKPSCFAKFEPNPSVELCPFTIKERLKNIYERLSQEDTEPLIRELVKEIIPESSFQSGMIYSVEPYAKLLVPIVRIGGIKSGEPISIAGDEDGDENDPIWKSFHSKNLIVGSSTNVDNPMAFFCGSFGNETPFGVLYLEKEGLIGDLLHSSQRAEFLALLDTFSDILSLR